MSITDLFNNTAYNDIPFILIHNISEYVIVLENKIYGYNIEKIKNLFIKQKINYNNYRFLYHIYAELNGDLPSTFVMAHHSVVQKPLNYVFIRSYENGYIWCPEANDNYHPFGLFYTNDSKKPIGNYGIVNTDYLLNIPNKLNKLGSVNEFNSLSHPSNIQYTVLRAKSYTGKRELNLQYLNNIYFSEQGHIKIKDQCLTNVNDNDTALTTCNSGLYTLEHNPNVPRQTWFLRNNNNQNSLGYDIVSQYDNKCLTKDLIINDDCKGEFKKIQKKQNLKFKGDIVTLVSSDNPWHKNILDTEFDDVDNSLNILLDNVQKYTFASVPETTKKKSGYSFKDRIEHMHVHMDNKDNLIEWITLFIIVFLIILIIVMRRRSKRIIYN